MAYLDVLADHRVLVRLEALYNALHTPIATDNTHTQTHLHLNQLLQLTTNCHFGNYNDLLNSTAEEIPLWTEHVKLTHCLIQPSLHARKNSRKPKLLRGMGPPVRG